MGEYADMILDGDMCQICGLYMADSDGVPRTCADCVGAVGDVSYVTFARHQKHRINGKYVDSFCVAVIKCNDKEDGLKLAFTLFSTQFDKVYHENEFNLNIKNYRRGFIKVN